jgi:hypothetical protein
MEASGGEIRISASNNFPLIINKESLYINANLNKILKIKMLSSSQYLSARVFFKRVGDRDFNNYNVVEIKTGQANKYRTYYIDLRKNPAWTGTVTNIMINPAPSTGDCFIDHISFEEPSFYAIASSYWQEFFTFEMPQLSTFNFIYGPKINGISINTYIYWLVMILAVLLLSVNWFRSKDIYRAYAQAGRSIIIICVLFWVILDVRYIFDQSRAMALDVNTFKGKSLEEKRAIITAGDFYAYLKFCESKIPAGSGMNYVFPGYYYFREKAMYYLAPIYETNDPEYVLVYDPNGDLKDAINKKILSGFKLFAKLKEGQLILKK